MNSPKSLSWPEILEIGAPEVAKRFKAMEQTVVVDGALSAKTKVLMMLVCDALLAHEGGVAALAGRARALGASEAEIADTVEVAFLMGGIPALATGANAFKDRV